jgi:DNA invertase Pin-like site-specific DNA recombinase
MIIGYARVSAPHQKLNAQLDELKAHGCEKIYQETQSGVTRRPQLEKAIARLKPDDVFVVTKFCRVARSTRDLLNICHQVREAGANVRSLFDSWIDTTTPQGNLILTLMAGVAEFERELIIERTHAGRRRAMKQGAKMGRKQVLTLHQQMIVKRRLDDGETTRAIARDFAVSHSTIARIGADQNETDP